MQVFLDHASFLADQTLRRSPVGPLLRKQLAVYEASGGAAYATHSSTPATSGAGEEKDAGDEGPQLFDYCVAAIAPVDCCLSEVLSGEQRLGGSFTELVVRTPFCG